MRDSERIRDVLKEVENVWQHHPDWRLGQLISNVAAWADQPVWDIEEGTLIEELRRHLSQLEDVTNTKP